MKQPDFWRHRSAISLLMMPFSCLYSAVAILRRLLSSPFTPSIPVICIGNVTVGGAGKTPTALAIGKILIESGHKIIFLSRGYGGKLQGPVFVDSKIHTAIDVGDEPLLLARLAPVIIAKNRKAGAILAASSGADFIIMDDGLQNPSIDKTKSLLVIDGNFGIGNGMVMPAGPLRESLQTALRRANAVIIIGDDRHNIAAKIGNSKLIKARIAAQSSVKAEQKYVAFAGIANPDKFFASLAECNYQVVEKVTFSDHYHYTKNDIENLRKAANKLGAELITTEKDFVRLSPEEQARIQTLPIEIIWDDIDTIKSILK